MLQADFLNTITNVLGLSVKQREVISKDRYYTISTIIHWKYDNIRECCTTKSKLTTTSGEYFYGDLKIKCLQSLSWWATDLTLLGKYIVLANFDTTMMVDFIDEATLD